MVGEGFGNWRFRDRCMEMSMYNLSKSNLGIPRAISHPTQSTISYRVGNFRDGV